MAKIVQLNGQRPGGWAKERWVWMRRVRRDGDLSPMTRLVAQSLAVGYANAETAECRPGAAALAEDCASSVRTIERALGDLERAGWIERLGGEGPGVCAAIRFRFPGERPPVLSGERPPVLTPTPASSDGPPTPPYKDEPNLNHRNRTPRQRLRGLPRPTMLSAMIAEGSEQEAAWNRWLADRGQPPLCKIGRKIGVGMVTGWELPWNWPPNPDDRIATGLAERFAEWLRSIA